MAPTTKKAKAKQAPAKTPSPPPAPPPPPPAPAAATTPPPFVYQRARLCNCEELQKLLQSSETVGVHFELTESDEQLTNKGVVVVALQWSTAKKSQLPPWVIHGDSASLTEFAALMNVLFSKGSAIKIVCGLQTVASWLANHGLKALVLTNTVDLQLYYGTHVGPEERAATMVSIADHCGVPASSSSEAVAFDPAERKKELAKHMLAHKFIQAMVKKATLLTECYAQGVAPRITKVQRKSLCELAAHRFGGNDVASVHTAKGSGSHEQPEASVLMRQSECEIAASFTYQRATMFDRDELQKMLESCRTVGVHFEMTDVDMQTNKRVVVATLEWSKECPHDGKDDAPIAAWVIHEDSASPTEFVALMNVLFTKGSAIKIVCGLRSIASWLASHGLEALVLTNTVDLQLFYETHVDAQERAASLVSIADHCGVSAGTYREAVEFDAAEHKKELTHQFLAHKFIKKMIKKAALLNTCYTQGVALTTSSLERTALCEMTARRWIYAGRYDGNPVIWFDSDRDFMPCSLERLGSYEQVEASVPMLRLECEIASLLALLPDRYRDAVHNIENALERLVDINLDIGRVPHGYLGYRERVELDGTPRRPSLTQWLSTRLQAVVGSTPPSTARLVDADDLSTVLDRLGGEGKIGGDNRAGVDRQLHRISVMRDKNDTIFGLTMRVGRTLHFASNYLLDLLRSEARRHKSVLLLGRPGSGKTTLIRDIARCVSASGENVCIIDTSNEIGGDGLVPHACIGWARRMMVKSLNDQARVMVECVQNHTVETLIVDEIGRKAEVDAAGTVRQRGPRMIASAHGDLRSLIKNQDLKGLIGGVQSVTVGDKEAEKNSLLGKVQAKRGGNPIFDVIVELDHVHRGRCRIIWDVAKAVDDVLSGDVNYAVETRVQTFDHPGVQVLTL